MTPTCYVDPIAQCVVFYGTRRGSRALQTLVDHARTHEGAQPDWPVVRQGREHERRHLQVTAWLDAVDELLRTPPPGARYPYRGDYPPAPPEGIKR